MSKYEFTVKETIEHYKEKGSTYTVICLGDPLTGVINYELIDIEIERFYELTIGRYQAGMKVDKNGNNALIITLIPPQAKEIYQDYKKHLTKTQFESTIRKQYTMFDSTKTAPNNPPVGFCHYITHPGYLTRKMMEQHSCLCKNGKLCPHLEKFETHMYWTQKKLKKERKKSRLMLGETTSK